MLYIDTGVLLAVLTSEAHSSNATTFLAQAKAPMAISTLVAAAQQVGLDAQWLGPGEMPSSV